MMNRSLFVCCNLTKYTGEAGKKGSIYDPSILNKSQLPYDKTSQVL